MVKPWEVVGMLSSRGSMVKPCEVVGMLSSRGFFEEVVKLSMPQSSQ